MYNHVSLGAAARRLVNTPLVTYWPGGVVTNTVSLTVATNPNGMIRCVMSIDGLLEDGKAAWAIQVVDYPFALQKEAADDAMLFAARLHLPLRLATPDSGWHDLLDETGKSTPKVIDTSRQG